MAAPDPPVRVRALRRVIIEPGCRMVNPGDELTIPTSLYNAENFEKLGAITLVHPAPAAKVEPKVG